MGSYEPSDSELHVEAMDGDIPDTSNGFEHTLFDNKEFPDLCDDFVLEQLSRIGLTTQFDDELIREKDLSLVRDSALSNDNNESAFDLADHFISYPDPDSSCVDQDQQLVDFTRTENVVAKTDVSEQNIGENGICASQGNQENLLCCYKSGEDFLSGNVGSQLGDAVDSSGENVQVPIAPLSLTTEPAECVQLSSDTKNTMDSIEESMNYGWVDKEKQDSLAGGMADSINQKQQTEKNSCIIATQLPVVDSGFATKVSTSSLLPMISGSADDITCRQLVSNDLVIDGCNGDPSCSNVVDSCRLHNTEEKDNSKLNLDFVSTSSGMVLSPPRRSTRRNKISQFGKLGTTSTRHGKTVKKKLQGELIFNAVRRKRSCPCIRARSSTWGSTLDFVPVKENELTQKDRNDLIQVETQRADRRTVDPGNGRKKKARAASSVAAKEKSDASNDHSNHVRLKVKMGGQKGKRSLTVVQSELFDLPNHMPTVVSKCVTRSGDSTSTEIIENDDNSKLEDGLYVEGQYDYASKDLKNVVSFPGGRILDSPHVDKDLESTVTQDTSVGNIFGSFPRGYSQVGTEGMEEVICRPYSDPGTSPDSEVISLIQDISLGADAVLTTNQTVGPTVAAAIEKEFISSSKQCNSGEVKGTPYTLDGSIAGGEKQLGQNKKNESVKHRWDEKIGHGYNLIDNSYLVSSGNESRNSSNDNIETHKLLELGDLGDSLKVESISRSSELLEKHVGVESSEISTLKGFLDVDKTVGLNASSKSTFEVREQKSAASVTASSRRKNAREQKKQENRKSVNKRKVKEKHPLGQAVHSGESHRETGEGTSISSGITGASGSREPAGLMRDETMGLDIPDCQVASIANDFGSEDVSKLSISSSGLDGQLPLPNAWVRCDDCYKWRCISTELADSIEATNCKWICSDNMDKAFADCSIPQEKSNAAINAELELSEFSGEEDASCAHPVAKGLEGKQSTVPKQAPWRSIVSNLFLHRNRKTQTIDEIMICHCKPPANGGLGCGDECLNRILNIECVRGTCPCGDRCSNQQFQKRKYAKLECFRCGKKGYGLQLLENVSEGDFLIEYVGEVLDLNAYEARQREYASRGQKHFYFMTLNGSEVIDACAKGNLGRFINHSCDPNCRTEKWMVNGEVCIGLFAIRNIKKGEEVTFDYNYVRVFGAAAKKCVCGSSECRGYIGGDPLNTDAVVQGDSDEEFPEPVMVHGNGKIEKVADKMTSNTISDGERHVDETVVLTSSDENLGSSTRMEKSTRQREDAVQPIEHYSVDRSLSPVQPQMPIKTELVMNKSLPCIQSSEFFLAENNSISTILSSSQLQEASSAVMDTSSKSSSNGNSICDSVKERPNIPKARSPPKSSRSLKEGKSRSNPGVAKKTQTPANKPKKVLEGVASNAPKGVEEFLNVLLDPDGAISKKKDAAKGYLKLLFVTASSGDNVKGEAVQSTRDLSIILDALLKTKKRTVLNDIINKNGLQMLHNIMKQNRKNFNRTPIIRKLLKILESLAEKEILTLELIHSGPPCVGMESFRESIMQLTNHNDIQVHQIARNFRDKWMPHKWMPRAFRRNGYLDRDGINTEQLSGVHCNRSATYDRRCDRGLRPVTDIDSISQTVRGANPSFAYIEKDGRSYEANGSRTRKRKSRWDQPGKGNSELQFLEFVEDQKVKQKLMHGMQQSEIKEGVQEEVHDANADIVCRGCDDNISEQAKSAATVDEMQKFHDDAPPGFPSVPTYDVSPTTSNLSSDIHHKICSCEVVTGCVQERFLSHLPVAYGVPLLFVEKLATHQPQMVNSWDISPGIPFHPFPPLPLYPRERSNSIPPSGSMRMENEESQRDSLHASHHHTDAGSPCTSGARQANVASTGSYNHQMGGRTRCSSGNLGRRYFRQQKWNSARCGSWVKPRKMGWGFKGNNSRSGTCSLGLENLENEKVDVRHSEVVSGGDQNMNSAHYQNPECHWDH